MLFGKTSVIILFSVLSYLQTATAQPPKTAVKNPVFVDKAGVLRWTKDKKEAAFFGVNYTVPFAYGYRSHKVLQADIEKAIDQDVYHFSRLGLDAFRVHVWDTEISDSIGNLLHNEHLRLFDYLLFKLKQHNIRILITPIAFWGNGYPEKDEKTISFVSKYGKGNSVVNEEAIVAQERYMKQFFEHVNSYTGQTYGSDTSVIAMEINNEPHHSGPKARTTEYINRLAAAVRSTGWTKPVFYNISESPAYADAVAKANVDGFAFQWYPTGLVANRTLQGNYLPHVDEYRIPFGDTIPQYFGKARMVYEFDAGDIYQSNMYPAMAKSFRAAGFQWATQFAYDPLATAYANTEYQTHFLNLAYTPSKAISLLIASKAFHVLPRGGNFGRYPADSLFGDFRVSYINDLSEMNTIEAFYHSNHTATAPKKPATLQHIAGVGSSPIVSYTGTGAYFFDQLADGVWRLEVMPDAITLRDPFAKASPNKPVVAIAWNKQLMKINLPNLGEAFSIKGLNEGNLFNAANNNDSFQISPGTYLLQRNDKPQLTTNKQALPFTHNMFVAPPASTIKPWMAHTPAAEVTAGKSFVLSATLAGVDSIQMCRAELRNTAGQWKTIPFTRKSLYVYEAVVPAEMVTPGMLSYRITVQHGTNKTTTFPGGFQGDPYAWDNTNDDMWHTYVAALYAPFSLFEPTYDRGLISQYNTDWRNNKIAYTTGDEHGKLLMNTSIEQPKQGQETGFQLYVADKLQMRSTELQAYTTVKVKAGTTAGGQSSLKLVLIMKDGSAYNAVVQLNGPLNEYKVPLSEFKAGSALLLPRPYPGFQALQFSTVSTTALDLRDMDKLQVLHQQSANNGQGYVVSLQSVYLSR